MRLQTVATYFSPFKPWLIFACINDPNLMYNANKLQSKTMNTKSNNRFEFLPDECNIENSSQVELNYAIHQSGD